MMSRAIGFWYMNPKLRTAWWPMSRGFMQRKLQSSPLPAFGPILAQKVAPQTSDPSKESAYMAERKGLQNLYTSVRFRPAPPNPANTTQALAIPHTAGGTSSNLPYDLLPPLLVPPPPPPPFLSRKPSRRPAIQRIQSPRPLRSRAAPAPYCLPAGGIAVKRANRQPDPNQLRKIVQQITKRLAVQKKRRTEHEGKGPATKDTA